MILCSTGNTDLCDVDAESNAHTEVIMRARQEVQERITHTETSYEDEALQAKKID